MHKLLPVLGLWSASLIASDFPIVIDPVVNATPPGSTVTAAYFTLENVTDKDITITEALSTTIGRVEIHLSTVENDIAKMEEQESVSIKAGGTLKFEHGGYHLMLMDLPEPLKENDTVDIILTTSVGDMLIEMPVRKIGMAGHDHDMDKMESDQGEAMSNEEPAEKMDADHDIKKDDDKHTGATKVVH